MDPNFAKHFATDWIDSWNSRDLPRVLVHYSDDFEMTSPFIISIAKEPSGLLKGKTAVADYWTKALAMVQNLRFELITTLIGVNSITLYYKNQAGRFVAEVCHFGYDHKVNKAFAHYSE
jgi:ketosteroid isomerase-like protein